MTDLIELPLCLMPVSTDGVICLAISILLFCLLWRYFGRKNSFLRKLTAAAADRIIDELWNLLGLKYSNRFPNTINRDSILIAQVLLLDSLILWFSCFRNMREGAEYFRYLRREAGTALIFLLLNLLILYAFALLFCVIAKGWRNGLLLEEILLLAWSIPNHNVVLYHGSPLFLSVLCNFKTAKEVAGGYQFSVDFVFFGLLFLFLMRFLLVRMISSEQITKEIVYRRVSILAGCSLLLATATFVLGRSSLSSSKWRWKRDVTVTGFPFCVLQDAVRMANPYQKPQGYDSSQFDGTHAVSPLPDVLPDLILVLNESFSDLCEVYQIPVDENPLSEFYNVEGAVYGKACAPEIGGGTNRSEFELLTSLSMYLLNSVAPFNYVDFNEMQTHCVNYLGQFGYQTMALHMGAPQNYSRDRAYSAMGFDEIVLGDAFSHRGMNGSRIGLDIENYGELIERTDRQSEAPRFSFLVTFQNHGGYEQNDDSLDTVHVLGDYGSLTDDLNEYFSSVRLSAEAFRFLTDYYSDSDRPVIICMVGDHQPFFADDLPLDGLSEEEKALHRRIVPFVFWANYEADFSDIPEWISMTDLVPTLLRTAGLPLSVYYQKLLNLQEQVPVRNGSGIMMDSDGNVFEFQTGCEYADRMNVIFCMEYNALIGGNEYRKDLFFLTNQH